MAKIDELTKELENLKQQKSELLGRLQMTNKTLSAERTALLENISQLPKDLKTDLLDESLSSEQRIEILEKYGDTYFDSLDAEVEEFLEKLEDIFQNIENLKNE